MYSIWILASLVVCGKSVLQPRSESMDQPAGPSKVYQAVSSKVSALEARLSEVDLENKQRFATTQAKYQKQLEARRHENEEMAVDNVKVARELEALKGKNSELVKEAVLLREDCDSLKSDLGNLKANFSTAFEFMSGSLKTFGPATRPKELQVLDELHEESESRGKAEAHMMRLREVSNLAPELASFSMLQMQTKRGPSPKDLLSVLNDGIRDLNEDAKKNEALLKHQFIELLTKENQRTTELEAEQKELSNSVQRETALNQGLVVAVKFLHEQRAQLEQRARSIRSYAERLGIREMPVNTESTANTAVPYKNAAHGSVQDVTMYADEKEREQRAEKRRKEEAADDAALQKRAASRKRREASLAAEHEERAASRKRKEGAEQLATQDASGDIEPTAKSTKSTKSKKKSTKSSTSTESVDAGADADTGDTSEFFARLRAEVETETSQMQGHADQEGRDSRLERSSATAKVPTWMGWLSALRSK